MTTQSTDAAKDKATPCYVSYLTFVNMLDHIKSLKVMPTQIDNTVWAGKFSGSNSVLLTAGLKFLKLLEGNRPTEQFRNLVFADAEQRKNALKDVLAGAYGADITNLSDKTPKMVDDTLRSLGTTDSTHRKAMGFFIQAAKGAGVEMPSTIAKRARNRPSAKRTPRNAGGGDNPPLPPPKPLDTNNQGNRTVVALASGGSVTLTLDVDLFKLSDADQQFVLGLVKHVREYTSPSKS